VAELDDGLYQVPPEQLIAERNHWVAAARQVGDWTQAGQPARARSTGGGRRPAEPASAVAQRPPSSRAIGSTAPLPDVALVQVAGQIAGEAQLGQPRRQPAGGRRLGPAPLRLGAGPSLASVRHRQQLPAAR